MMKIYVKKNIIKKNYKKYKYYKYYKKTRNALERSTERYLKKKKKYHRELNKNLSKEEKEEKCKFMRSYYLGQVNIFSVGFWIFLILRQLEKMHYIFLSRILKTIFLLYIIKNF